MPTSSEPRNIQAAAEGRRLCCGKRKQHPLTAAMLAQPHARRWSQQRSDNASMCILGHFVEYTSQLPINGNYHQASELCLWIPYWTHARIFILIPGSLMYSGHSNVAEPRRRDCSYLTLSMNIIILVLLHPINGANFCYLSRACLG